MMASEMQDVFFNVKTLRGDPSSRVAFTVGFDGTVLVKHYQICHAGDVVVGGAHPNHWMPVPLDDTLTNRTEQCYDQGLSGRMFAWTTWKYC
jgi:hypothetical protein